MKRDCLISHWPNCSTGRSNICRTGTDATLFHRRCVDVSCDSEFTAVECCGVACCTGSSLKLFMNTAMVRYQRTKRSMIVATSRTKQPGREPQMNAAREIL